MRRRVDGGGSAPGDDLQAVWTRRYAQADAPTDFHWFVDEVPTELRSLLDSGLVPDGRALDYGSGPGVATAFLAASRPTVGLDIAWSAMPMARARAAAAGVAPGWVVGAAPELPFPDATFALVFDRGCMHVLDASVWDRYLAEVARVLVPGGIAQLIERRFATGQLESLVPPQLELLEQRPVDFVGRDGRGIPMVDVRARRRG